MKIKLGLGPCDMERIARFCSGELYDFTGKSGCTFSYVCTDSREADAETMFVATRGERVDGHDYIIKAIEQGCRCILCEYVPTDISGKPAAYVLVENSMDAFALCAKGYRAERPLPSVAITGSVGKTTTKELTAAILRRSFNTYCTEGNFNSVIGMPMSLMEAGKNCEAAVFEMGMSGFGEVHSMTICATPKVAMVTNIGSSHLEYLKTRENIAKAKLEIAEGLLEGGILLLNGDEPLLRKPKHLKKGITVKYVGIENREICDIFAENIRVSEEGTTFDLSFEGRLYQGLKMPLIGAHFVYNAAFASAAALYLGADERALREGLASYTPTGLRQNISRKKGVTLIADCYNAAPESMKASVDTLCRIEAKRRIAVLGDMKELGKDSDEMHRAIGGYLAKHGVDMLFTLGKSGALIAEEAIKGGVGTVFAEQNQDNIASLAAEIADKLQEGDAILFKASRSMKLERVIDALFEA